MRATVRVERRGNLRFMVGWVFQWICSVRRRFRQRVDLVLELIVLSPQGERLGRRDARSLRSVIDEYLENGRVAVRYEVVDNPCRAKDAFSRHDDIENSSTVCGASDAR